MDASLLLFGALGLLMFAKKKPAAAAAKASDLDAIAQAALRLENELKDKANATPPAVVPPAKPVEIINTPTGLPPAPSSSSSTPPKVVPPAKPAPAPKPKVPKKPKPAKASTPAPEPVKLAPKPAPTVKDKKPVTLAQEVVGPPAPITSATKPLAAALQLAQYARLGGDLGQHGKPAKYVEQCQKAMGMPIRQVDGIYGSVTEAWGNKLGASPKMPSRVRTPYDAANSLAFHIIEGNDPGSSKKPSSYVKTAQRDMGMPTKEQDGAYGPKTQARGIALGVSMPKRPAGK